MCIARSIASGIGSHARSRLPRLPSAVVEATRSLRLQVGGKKPVEGHPVEAGQARMQMSIHVKVVGLSLVQGGHVPARVLSRTAPGELTCPNAEGTPAGRTDPGRRERALSSFVPQSWQPVIPLIAFTLFYVRSEWARSLHRMPLAPESNQERVKNDAPPVTCYLLCLSIDGNNGTLFPKEDKRRYKMLYSSRGSMREY